MKKFLVVLFIAVVIGVLLFTFLSSSEEKIDYVKIRLTEENYAFAVNKENTELLNEVNAILDEIITDGTIDKITEKYFSENEEEYKKYPGNSLGNRENQLVVATSTPFKPFEFSKIEGGKKLYMGIDIEIAAIIANQLGKELVIREYAFDKVLNAVESNEADIGMAGLTKNAERLERVNFTSVYYVSSQVLLVPCDDCTFEDCKTKQDVEKILSALDSDTKIGYQEATTSGSYLKGDTALGYKGYNVDAVGYSSSVLAAQALLDGELDYVIIDEGPAKIITKDMNK